MKLIFLLEERSMKFFLDGILPRILPEDVDFLTIPHEGKADLQKSIPRKLKAWTEPDVKFVIIQDQDSADCVELKKKLAGLCEGTGREVLIRIACRELEAWYFGDLTAVSKAYGIKTGYIKKKAKYRKPDEIIGPKRELQKLLPQLQQIDGAKKIARVMDIENNSSPSFHCLIDGVRRMCS